MMQTTNCHKAVARQSTQAAVQWATNFPRTTERGRRNTTEI